jgi:hypothetical protein
VATGLRYDLTNGEGHVHSGAWGVLPADADPLHTGGEWIRCISLLHSRW